ISAAPMDGLSGAKEGVPRLSGPPLNGESGIRTHGGVTHTRFPSVLLKPLGHLSKGLMLSKRTFRLYHNLDGARSAKFLRIQDLAKILTQPSSVDSSRYGGIGFEFLEGFFELCACSDKVAFGAMVHANGGLDETLVEQPEVAVF